MPNQPGHRTPNLTTTKLRRFSAGQPNLLRAHQQCHPHDTPTWLWYPTTAWRGNQADHDVQNIASARRFSSRAIPNTVHHQNQRSRHSLPSNPEVICRLPEQLLPENSCAVEPAPPKLEVFQGQLGRFRLLYIYLFEIRKIVVCFLWLSLPGDCRVTDEALLAETT